MKLAAALLLAPLFFATPASAGGASEDDIINERQADVAMWAQTRCDEIFVSARKAPAKDIKENLHVARVVCAGYRLAAKGEIEDLEHMRPHH
jgi:hypothetical protein